MRDTALDGTYWWKVVATAKAEFCDGTLANKSTCQKGLLIPKGDSGYTWDICLVEVLWKTVTRILNQRFTSAITFHDVLHGFWAVRVTGTDALEAKML